MGKKEGLLEKVRKIRRDQWIVLLLAGILVLVVSFPTADGQTGNGQAGISAGNGQAGISAGDGQAETSAGADAAVVSALEKRLEEILSDMEGAGDVRVMITVKDDGEKIVEKDVPASSRTVQEEQSGSVSSSSEEERQEATVFEKGSGYETPYVTKELSPRVEGVLVLAGGADNAVVKKDITDAVMALFDLEAHKIKVMKMHERRG